jgi:hypothetical protein
MTLDRFFECRGQVLPHNKLVAMLLEDDAVAVERNQRREHGFETERTRLHGIVKKMGP